MLQRFHPEQTAYLLQLMAEAIQAIDTALYSFEQKQAWLSGLNKKNPSQWEQHFSQQITWVYYEKNQVVGLLSGKEDYLDLLYVAPSQQGRGYGKMLLQKFLQPSPASIIRANASLAALPFFLSQQFVSCGLSFALRGQVSLPYHAVWIKNKPI